jgi:hypothetical protein
MHQLDVSLPACDTFYTNLSLNNLQNLYKISFRFIKRHADFSNFIGIKSFKFDAGEVAWLGSTFRLRTHTYPNDFTTAYAKMVATFGSLIETRVGYATQRCVCEGKDSMNASNKSQIRQNCFVIIKKFRQIITIKTTCVLSTFLKTCPNIPKMNAYPTSKNNHLQSTNIRACNGQE